MAIFFRIIITIASGWFKQILLIKLLFRSTRKQNTFGDISSIPSGSPDRISVPALYTIKSGENSSSASETCFATKPRYSSSSVKLCNSTFLKTKTLQNNYNLSLNIVNSNHIFGTDYTAVLFHLIKKKQIFI